MANKNINSQRNTLFDIQMKEDEESFFGTSFRGLDYGPSVLCYFLSWKWSTGASVPCFVRCNIILAYSAVAHTELFTCNYWNKNLLCVYLLHNFLGRALVPLHISLQILMLFLQKSLNLLWWLSKTYCNNYSISEKCSWSMY